MGTNLKVLISIAAKRYCQQVLVLFLREFFQKELNNPQFRWDSNPAKTKILISSEYQEALMKLPCVIVNDIYGDTYQRTLGQEMIWEHKKTVVENGMPKQVVDKVTTHGTYALKCKIDVFSYKVSTRRYVADLVEAALRHIGTEVLKSAGITISNCSLGPMTNRIIGNSVLQISPIDIEFVTEWHKDASDLATLEQILIEEINISEEKIN